MTSPTLERSSTLTLPARTAAARPAVPPELRIADNPAAAVLRAATRGPIFRDTAAQTTGLSIATVNRQVSALLSAGLLRERADLTASGAVGRPRVPFEVDTDSYTTLGVHIGATVTRIVAADLAGRILGGLEIATPQAGPEAALTIIARSAKAFLDRLPRRRPLWTGIALAGRVDPAAGVVDHPRLDWQAAPVAAIFGGVLDLPVSVAAHVEAMAAAELLLNSPAEERPGSSLYIYARETAGIAVTLHDRVHTPANGPGSIAHLPTGSDVDCSCGRRGCLEATVGESALLARAVRAGIVPKREAPRRPVITDLYRAAESGAAAARELLTERAEILGRTAALVRDMFNPDRIVLGGQAFTGYRPGIDTVARAFAQSTTLPTADLRISRFGGRVQEHAAAVTALSVFYADPLSAMRRASRNPR
ncbi:ROK family protein [Nocardia sp. CDC159]|uniref:ROK family protein n=1 Tax=Nocardia pulmonis TaxID=2951408 RepID=A0A9X2E1S7_9NOCA|nr:MULTISPECIES: ROK family protein [Nocardia]MCM6772632.1 ROK family protein [Nocardia pulmonis]MCM6786065.1 ROK family protein [Nocardia sp. CDC159]